MRHTKTTTDRLRVPGEEKIQHMKEVPDRLLAYARRCFIATVKRYGMDSTQAKAAFRISKRLQERRLVLDINYATIRELREKVKSINLEMIKNAGSENSSKVDRSVGYESLPENRELKLELADVYNELGHAYQRIGNEGHANVSFMESMLKRGRGER